VVDPDCALLQLFDVPALLLALLWLELVLVAGNPRLGSLWSAGLKMTLAFSVEGRSIPWSGSASVPKWLLGLQPRWTLRLISWRLYLLSF